jgi:thermitase
MCAQVARTYSEGVVRKLVLSLLSVAALTSVGVCIGLFPFGGPQAVASEIDTLTSTPSIGAISSPSLEIPTASEPDSRDYSAIAEAAENERWGVERVQAADAIEAAGPLSRVIVAVIDTGIDDSDSSLSGKILASINLTGAGNIEDENGHGTHMAGTIVAIAPNAALLNVKSADKRGRCDSETVATAIRWAANHGALVINVSLEVAPSTHLQESIDYAWQKGAIVIAAAGNGGTTAPAYPAAYPQVVAVAGTNESDGLAVLSNHGDWVDISAPGYKIYSQLPGGTYGLETGTSPAAAHVSGVAALLFAVATDTSGNGFVNDEVRNALESSASPLSVNGSGSGIVNALSAMQVVAP